MTLTDKLERFFREHPNTWIDGKDLAGTAGTYAWRSRVSDVRKRFQACGGDIINRQKRSRIAPDAYVVRSDYQAVFPS
jgi:hypothetical protein